MAALLAAITVLSSALLGPVLAHFERPEAISIHAAFSSVCHQQPERCWWLLDRPLAVCVRCLGFYVGAIAALLAGWRFWGPAFVLAALSVLATWLGELSGLMLFTPWLWFVTGLSLGSTCVAALSDTASWWKRSGIGPCVNSMSAGTPTGRWPTAGAMNRAPTDGLEHLAFKRRGAIHCAGADEPPYLGKLIDTQLYLRNTVLR